MERATKRPPGFIKPPTWSNSPPPQPAPLKNDEPMSPTRYGDWEKKGVAWDF
nr:DUF1674 domain-containing protein [Qipengyuania sediminis]